MSIWQPSTNLLLEEWRISHDLNAKMTIKVKSNIKLCSQWRQAPKRKYRYVETITGEVRNLLGGYWRCNPNDVSVVYKFMN